MMDQKENPNNKTVNEKVFVEEWKERMAIAMTSQIVHKKIKEEKDKKIELLEENHSANSTKINQLKEMFAAAEAQEDKETMKILLESLQK